MAKHWLISEWPTVWRTPMPPKPTQRQTPPPPGEWVRDAACAGQEPGWDTQLPGETRTQRDARQARAARICKTACPVLAECSEWIGRADTIGDYGVIAGRTARASKGKQSGRWVEVA